MFQQTVIFIANLVLRTILQFDNLQIEEFEIHSLWLKFVPQF